MTALSRRAWELPVAIHVAGLAVVLLVLMPLVGTRASFSADEGAAAIQARALADDGTWNVPHPLGEIDPEDAVYPLELAEVGERAAAPFAKHPLYALGLAGLWRLGGITVLILGSVAGAVGAAAAAAGLAGRLDGRFARPALWATGLATPLLFDAYVVMAHTLAAAVAGATAWAVLAGRSRRWTVLLVVVGAAAATFVRTEGLLFAGALALGGLAVGWRGIAAAAGFGGAAAYAIDQWWLHAIIGPSRTGALTATADLGAERGGVGGRVEGLLTTLVRGGPDGGARADVLLVVSLVAVAVAVVLLRRRAATELVGGATAVAVVAAAVRVFGPHTSVSGLFLVCPLLWGGLWSVSRPALRGRPVRFLGVVTLAFTTGVAATQYSRGGTAEWGGRYFALGIPLAVPLVLVCLGTLVERSPLQGRHLAAGLLALSLPIGALAILGLRATHHRTERFVDAVAGASRVTPAGDGGRPVVVTTAGLLPRLAWSTFPRQRWLLVSPAGGDQWLTALRIRGVEQVTLVTPRARPLRRLPDGASSADLPSPLASWQLQRIELR